MNASLDKALYYLTGNGNLDEVPVEDIEALTREYPYFTIGHLLLVKKLKLRNDTRLDGHLQKTALYFSNPYWLHYQLLNFPPAELDFLPATPPPAVEANHAADASIASKPDVDEELLPAEVKEEEPLPITTEFTHEEIDEASEMAHEQLGKEEIPLPPADAAVPITEEFTSTEIEEASELAHEHLAEDDLPHVDAEVPITEEFSKTEIEEASELAHEHLGEKGVATLDPPPSETGEAYAIITEEVAPGDTPGMTEAPVISKAEEPLPAVKESQPEEQLQRDRLHVPPPVRMNFPAVGNEKQEVAFKNEFEPTAAITATPADTHITGEETSATAGETGADKDTFEEYLTTPTETEKETVGQQQPMDEHEVMFQNIKAMLDATTEDASKGVADSIVPIDPYHTIDYFASQGIKLDLEPQPNDKLGKQVKKFTQWLKHMKKLGPEDAIEQLDDPQAEAEVEQSAHTSNTVREVVTEAMALVLEKQGKKAKAIELYNKLSFLNPHKSAYFADKIKNLKES